MRADSVGCDINSMPYPPYISRVRIMARVTSKLQVTIPEALAKQFGIRPGDELDWVPAGEVVRVVPAKNKRSGLQDHECLKLFDQATARCRA